MIKIRKIYYLIIGFINIIYLLIFKTKSWDDIFYLKSQIEGSIENRFIKKSHFAKILSRYGSSETLTAKQYYDNNKTFEIYKGNFKQNPKRILTDNLMLDNINNIINEDKNIKNIVEIGSMDGNFINSLSTKYENINFYGIDYKFNKNLERKNLKFINFQKNIFENFNMDKNNIDLIFFKEVAILLNSKEIIEFYNLINHCKYISLVEYDFIERFKLKNTDSKTLHWKSYHYTHDYELIFTNHKILSKKFNSVSMDKYEDKRYLQSLVFKRK